MPASRSRSSSTRKSTPPSSTRKSTPKRKAASSDEDTPTPKIRKTPSRSAKRTRTPATGTKRSRSKTPSGSAQKKRATPSRSSKKSTTKKGSTKKTPVRKPASAKKASTKKASAKKTPSRKTPAKRGSTKKESAKKAERAAPTPRRTPSRRAAAAAQAAAEEKPSQSRVRTRARSPPPSSEPGEDDSIIETVIKCAVWLLVGVIVMYSPLPELWSKHSNTVVSVSQKIIEDVVAACSAALVVAPVVEIIERAAAESYTGKATVLYSMTESVKELFSKPYVVGYLSSPRFFSVFVFVAGLFASSSLEKTLAAYFDPTLLLWAILVTTVLNKNQDIALTCGSRSSKNPPFESYCAWIASILAARFLKGPVDGLVEKYVASLIPYSCCVSYLALAFVTSQLWALGLDFHNKRKSDALDRTNRVVHSAGVLLVLDATVRYVLTSSEAPVHQLFRPLVIVTLAPGFRLISQSVAAVRGIVGI